MKSRPNREVTWTSLELNGLLEDEESHVHFSRTIKHLALHPYHLNNVQRGLNQILKLSLNTYDKELKGFVLAFRNCKLLTNLGEVLYDSPFIHVDIEADFYLFCPTVGTFLKGIVNKKGLDHIVVLVHKIYTVSIPKPDDMEEWPDELLEIGQEVKCCVKQIDNKSQPPFICATLKSNYLQGCRLPESTYNIDNMDSAIESCSANSTMRIDGSINEVSEDDCISGKERKKDRKRHKKSHENNPEFILTIENESESNDNIGNDISRSIKSEKKRQYQNMQDTVLNTDDSLNNSEADNTSKKHKKNKKMSKSLLNNSTVLSEHAESRKAVKRENSIPLDNITETGGKKRKKHAKKSRESDSESVFTTENEEKLFNNTLISGRVKYEKEEQYTHRNHSTSNTDLFSNNSEVSVSKKHKKNKKSPMKMSDSESEGRVVKIKIEKQDPFIDRITNESQISSRGENQVQDPDENVELPKFLKKENFNRYDYMSDKERKKSSKKHAVTSRESKSESAFKIKNEDDTINDVSSSSDKERKKSPKKHVKADPDSKSELRIKSEDATTNDMDIFDKEKKKSPKKQAKASKDSGTKSGLKIKNEDDKNTSDKERRKSSKKYANLSGDSDAEIRIKSENITNDVKDISRAIKYDSDESQHAKRNTSEIYSNSSNFDLDHVSEKSKKKKKTPTILSDSELKYPIKVKTEKVLS